MAGLGLNRDDIDEGTLLLSLKLPDDSNGVATSLTFSFGTSWPRYQVFRRDGWPSLAQVGAVYPNWDADCLPMDAMESPMRCCADNP